MGTPNSSKVITLTNAQKPFLERNETLTRYYSDIRHYDVLSDDEHKELFKKYYVATGQEKENIKNIIFNHNARLVIAVARKYCTGIDNLNDLISEGNFGLLNAIDKFDLKRESSFHKCALFHIRREINLFRLNYSNLVQKTNRSKTDHLARNISSEFIQKEGRVPTTQELLEEYNKKAGDKKQISDHKDLVNVEYVYIDSLEQQRDDFTDCQAYLDYTNTTASSNDYLTQIEEDSNNDKLSYLMKNLNPKEKLAIRLMYGMETGFEESLSSIGLELGCSSERARQICATAMEKMQKLATSC